MKNKYKSLIKLGKESYGTKDIEQAFKEAFAPYFVEIKKENKSRSERKI